MTETLRTGRFTWRELITSEIPKAKAFYTELFNWKFVREGSPDAPYFVVMHGTRRIAGVRAKTVLDPAGSIWTSYVTVEGVDASLARTREADGLVYAPKQIVPDTLEHAVVADPSGVPFAIVHRKAGDEAVETPVPFGDFAYEIVETTDADDTIRFGAEVFGWTFDAERSTFSQAGVEVASLLSVASPRPARVLGFVRVPSLEDARVRAVRLGANVLESRLELPGVGHYAVLIDPNGVTFCVLETL